MAKWLRKFRKMGPEQEKDNYLKWDVFTNPEEEEEKSDSNKEKSSKKRKVDS